jgi:pimeloyl-ACP methyl ester carboxylesterase
MVRVQEVGRGPAIVFVHGGSASGANWAPLAARLQNFRCILLDRPGCGLSARIADDLTTMPAFREYADSMVADVLDALHLPEADLVATSLGGHFALRAAAAHPSRIRRIVEFGFVPGAPMQHVPMSMRVATLPGLGKLMTSIPPTKGAIRMIMRQLGLGPAIADGRVSTEMRDWFLSLLRDTRTMRNETNLPRAILKTGGRNPEMLPVSLVENVRCPVRFVWGGNDPFGGAEVAEPFIAGFPNAELELWPEASHAPWFDDADRAAATVTDFLQP